MYVCLDYNHRITYKNVVKNFLRWARGKDLTKLDKNPTSNEIELFKVTNERMYPDLIGAKYKIEYLMKRGEALPVGITIEWRTQSGLHFSQTIQLAYRRSNLGSGYVGYFVCPHTGKMCRTLYTDGRVFCSRHYLGSRYSYQNEGKFSRACSQMHRNKLEERLPILKHRKQYAGKPTRWFRKAIKMYVKEGKALEIMDTHMLNFYKRHSSYNFDG